MSNSALLKWWMVLGGAIQVLMGVLGVLDTSAVGSSSEAFLTMNMTHAAVHTLGGLLSVGIGLFLTGAPRSTAASLYGALFVVGFVLNVASPDLWGRMDVPANTAIHIMHATIAVVTLATAYLARSGVEHIRLAHQG